MSVPALWKIKKAIHEFKLRLLKAQGDNVLKIVLFGSVAREEHKEGSDIDVFVLLKKNDDGLPEEKTVMSVVCRLNREKSPSEIYISPLILTEAEYEECKQKSLIFHNIKKDGVPIYVA
jgi:predicted nucleotidyltransferase